MKAKEAKGIYNLNPTSMVMKQGSKDERDMHAGDYKGSKPRVTKGNDTPARTDMDGGCEERELAGHSAMPTRMGHDKHSTGERRMHEDHHYAVRQMKGKY